MRHRPFEYKRYRARVIIVEKFIRAMEKMGIDPDYSQLLLSCYLQENKDENV